MPKITAALIGAAANIDPLTLAILFLGLVGLGVIWLAALVIKTGPGSAKK